jgi:hypothetical protein
MRKLGTVTLTTFVLMLMLSGIARTQEKPWFDFKNCAFCKLYAAEPGLMQHMTHEYHFLTNGFLMFTHVDKEYDTAYQRVQAGMKQVIADMMAGKQVYTCEHCGKLGQFGMAGVYPQQVSTAYGSIMLYTSGDTAMVTKLKDFCKRSMEESAKAVRDTVPPAPPSGLK